MSLPSSSVANGKPPTVRTPQLTPPGKDFTDSIKKEIQNLESKDDNTVIVATASIFMLAAHSEALTHLPTAISPLVTLLDSPNEIIQRNSIAALTAIMQLDEPHFNHVISSENVVKKIVDFLKLKDESKSVLRLNAAAAISAIAAGGIQGIEKLFHEKAEYAIMDAMVKNGDEKEIEGIVDAFCSITMNSDDRSSLASKTAIQKLLSMLSYSSHEICVRSLLALGALVGSSNEALDTVIHFDGSLPRLLELSKSADPDVKSIASELLLGLSKNEYSKPLLQQRLKQIAESRKPEVK